MKAVRGLAIAATLTVGLCVPASSAATVTIGSNLNRAPTVAEDCSAMIPRICTFMSVALPTESQAPGGLVSPVNGTVVSWRIRTGTPSVSNATPRVIRPFGGGLFVGTPNGAAIGPPPGAISPSYPTNLPILIGDYFGIDCCNGSGRFFAAAAGTRLRWHPPLVFPPFDGARAPSNTTTGLEVTAQAEIEPISELDIEKVKSLGDGKIKVTATVSNPGTLIAGDRRDPKTDASAAKATRYLKRKRTEASAPGEVSFKVKPTTDALDKLDDDGRFSARLRVSFTPLGGLASVETKKAKLKP